MDQEHINSLAEKIAQLIVSASSAAKTNSVQESIDAVTARLDRLEAVGVTPVNPASISPQHPSQDRFAVAEAIVDSLFGRDAREKTCTFESNDRPCDHCSMCSSRGF